MVPESEKAKPRYAIIAVLMAALVGAVVLQAATADHQPADKGFAAASELEVFSAPAVGGASSLPVTLLNATLKTSKGTDLVLSLSLECSLWTTLSVIGNDDEQAAATLTIWLTIDKGPLNVTSGQTGGTAPYTEVVFCNRVYRMATTNVDDVDQWIDTYLATKAAHAFNFLALDLAAGTHDITVEGRLDMQATTGGHAQAAVGTRSLIIGPTRLANDFVLAP